MENKNFIVPTSASESRRGFDLDSLWLSLVVADIMMLSSCWLFIEREAELLKLEYFYRQE